jgi:hypothetical protein
MIPGLAGGVAVKVLNEFSNDKVNPSHLSREFELIV